MSESLKQNWSVCLFSTISHRSRWDVTDAGDIFRAGRSWQIVVSLPLCCVTGLIIATPTPAGISAPSSALIHFCSTFLLLHFSLSWFHLTSSSCSLIHLASNPPSFTLSLSTSSLAPLLSTLYSSSACSARSGTSGSFSISVLNITSLSFQTLKKKTGWTEADGSLSVELKLTANCYHNLQAITF